MDIELSQEDIEWLNTEYPNIKVDLLSEKLEGEIGFIRAYEGYEIADSYSVRISLKTDGNSILPKVYEISNKIASIVKKYKKELIDLHVNSDGSFCLAISEKEQSLFDHGFTIKEFFKNSLEPFLYQMSYYDHKGEFPWGEYAHRHLGYLELYAEEEINKNRLKELVGKEYLDGLLSVNRQSLCICGSQRKIRSCHPLIYKAIRKIKGA